MAVSDEDVELSLHSRDALKLHVEGGFQFEEYFFVSVEPRDHRTNYRGDHGRNDRPKRPSECGRRFRLRW